MSGDAIPVRNVQNLHLLEKRQKILGQICPETLFMEVSNDLTLSRNVPLAYEHVLLKQGQSFPHR